jgi:hypothetical protein
MFAIRTVVAALLGCALAGNAAAARPLIIEESSIIQSPDPAIYPSFGFEVATNGEEALIAGFDDKTNVEVWQYYVLLYRKVNGQWVFQRVLQHHEHFYDSYSYPVQFALRGNLAVVALAGGPNLWRRTASGWQQLGNLGGLTEDVELEGNRTAFSVGEPWDAYVADINSDGTFTRTYLPGQPRSPDDEHWGGPVDLSGNRVIIATPDTWDLEPQEIPIYERSTAGTWGLLAKLQVPYGVPGLGGPVALRGDDAIVDASGGAYVWRLPNFYSPVDRLQAVDNLGNDVAPSYREIEKSGDFVFVHQPSSDRAVSVINVFRPGSSGRYEHVAVLAAKNGVSLRGSFDISGNTVMADGNDQAVHVFELPADFSTPAPRYENFDNGASGWTPQPGAQFTVASGSNRVYRQSNTNGDARSLLGGTDWRDQGIEADIRPTEFVGSDRWVGLITRYQDAQNFVYVTLRSSGTVQLKRLDDGAIREMARAPLAVTVNRSNRVRLESVGGVHRVYVDGKLLLDVDDDTEIQPGQAGIAMYRARADYDNVVVTPSPHTTIFARNFDNEFQVGRWRLTGAGQWSASGGVFAQNSVGGDARADIGTPTDDQVVRATVRPIAYAAPSGTSERWTGLMARYVDERNYYYVSLRSGNTLSLRKVINGTITPLASLPFPVTLNTPYRVRLEAVSNQLRVYVNDVLRLQATDGSLARGSGGLVTFKAAAHFDNYDAYQP